MTAQTSRLEILESSLAKKTAAFDAKLSDHMAAVRSANGQPLNDKRNGHATLSRWERQNDVLRALDRSIESTKAEIDREKCRIANVSQFDVPTCLREFVESGVVTQWMKHPRFFFVTGVDKARIVVLDDGTIAHRYLKDVPSREQYAVFRDVFNAARALAAPTSPTPEADHG